jgi:hypothetical protein
MNGFLTWYCTKRMRYLPSGLLWPQNLRNSRTNKTTCAGDSSVSPGQITLVLRKATTVLIMP